MLRTTTGTTPHEPLQLGPVTLRNRIVFPAHLTNFSVDGGITDRHIAYYTARARGGAAMIITEEHTVHPSDRPYEKLIRGWDPTVVPGYRRLTDAVHASGARILAQLNHNGAQGTGMYTARPLWAPSSQPDPLFREVPVAVDERDIAELVDGYATVARHCRDGGFDGVEIQCSQASILRAFLAPGTNGRSDRYGGDVDGRARLLLEVVGAVRDALGPDRVVGVRLSGHDGTSGGVELAEAVHVAKLLDASGAVDYLGTSVGVATETLHLVEAPMSTPHGYSLAVPEAIRAAVGIPVVGVGRFTTGDQVRAALERGVCDLVGAVRAHIADPAFAGRILDGRDDEIRPCIGCNQDCIGRVGLNRPIGCAVNPRAGYEETDVPDAVSPRHVLVVGGGPAGLQTAVTAARRGHTVTVWEREALPGGGIRAASAAPYRGELLGVITALTAECARLGVEIRTGVHADAETVRAARPDTVVVATGARPTRPPWAGTVPRVVDVRDVLAGTSTLEGRVLVADELGFHESTSVAETEDGLEVALAHHATGAVTRLHVDHVVAVTHPHPVDDLWHEPTDDFPVLRVGDAVTPRRLDSAIIDGDRAGREL